MNIKINSDTVIVFDLDDTLYNELDFLRSAYKEISKKINLNDWKKIYATMFSKYRLGENVFHYLEENYKFPKEKSLALYRNHLPEIVPFAGVMEAFKSIQKLNGKIALITDGRSTTQRNKLLQLKITDFFSSIVISQEIGTTKPNLDNFRKIMQDLPASKYVYVGDNIKKDFIAPNLLNWCTIMILDSGKNIHTNDFENVDTEKLPNYYIESIKELSFYST
ncbi:HAD family hydrolase [Croceivirga sp. JEA036]|uniref:HAD family hydrolase n=1 Tax=Croceivirga sp. JEA036 TaxID=2721162 RepID=UPI00143C1138|nr:HAD family hydrolase [Croceivirga sp. JEA036]NJB35358.1 HAD family hydrolase [Croceivirga sp. JEA036]